MRTSLKRLSGIVLFTAVTLFYSVSVWSQPLWDAANKNKDVLRISTLFTAQDCRDKINTTEGLEAAVKWCKETGLTNVFIESFRGGYYAEKETLIKARDRFKKEGFDVAGCVTTVKVGKNGVGGWGQTPCYVNESTVLEFEKIFKYTASIFDLIMIDDFLFTECTCEDCIAAKGDLTWAKFRSDLLVEFSRDHILKPSKAENPNAKVIIKYPLWYDFFQERGYEVVRETKDYDFTWVGTETRDYNFDLKPGGTVQYNAFFIMRWLDGIGAGKAGGGWIDALGTTPEFYVEQARQTVLGNGKEIMLFHYGSLLTETNKYDGYDGTPIKNVDKLKKEIPLLFDLARLIKDKPLKGIYLPKLPNSEPIKENYIFSYFGMLGLPLVPGHELTSNHASVIYTTHALKDPSFSGKLAGVLNSGKQVLITEELAKRLTDQTLLENKNLMVFKTGDDPKKLLKLTQAELKPIRDKLLAPLGMKFDAPNKVSLYLLGDNTIIIENFNDEKVDVWLELPAVSSVQARLTIPSDGKAVLSRNKNTVSIKDLSPRTLVLYEYR
ncbi:MAG: hypothetical protein A2X05_13770 [Bacteroidetes bacterium GWE2_41_25]|nr:MAG: hypothetical protein A2X03_13245 [Bacteroidetes bacterium GWA2_40_15]OFX98551.1 MAG: hypothetical protein A2X06_03510 [Bacteroidetes bacterium GWC2_40_22]OFY13152.1 MAG: hypothetical protein A2X05_13770 [Bacteroidetes bacterium GWE2_41_25]OFY57423.1 MAG: hypothetical protein A2X04_16270 [Bacteroidetes bacterium GWF2_41_9]HAM09421.1 hypothetical protein [Bacteroidales bacterium]